MQAILVTGFKLTARLTAFYHSIIERLTGGYMYCPIVFLANTVLLAVTVVLTIRKPPEYSIEFCSDLSDHQSGHAAQRAMTSSHQT